MGQTCVIVLAVWLCLLCSCMGMHTHPTPRTPSCLSLQKKGGPVSQPRSHLGQPQAQSRCFFFRQPVPIPSYLLAMAVGELNSRCVDQHRLLNGHPNDDGH